MKSRKTGERLVIKQRGHTEVKENRRNRSQLSSRIV